MFNGLFVVDVSDKAFERVYAGAPEIRIRQLVNILSQCLTPEEALRQPELLGKADIIFSGWGAPILNKDFLEKARNLKVFFYAGASVKHFVTDEFWSRRIKLTTAADELSKSVAMFTVAQIINGLKMTWHYANYVRAEGRYPEDFPVLDCPGIHKTTVGLISLGQIARYVCEYLKHCDVNIIAYDPFVGNDLAVKLGVKLCSLEQVFAQADVVSLHSPLLKETEGMIRGRHFESMKRNASFINTARGAIVCEKEMIEVLQKRPDLFAALDVTYPEPPAKGSALYKLSNVMLTPHIAGPFGGECKRLGWYIVNELERYLNGQTLLGEISQEQIKLKA